MFDNCSFKKKKENKELNIGDNDKRGIVKLRSDCLIAFKNKSAENKPIIIKVIPGRIQGIKFIEKSSKNNQMKKIMSCVIVKIKSKLIELIFSRVSFLVKSNAAQKKADTIQIRTGIK